MNCPTCQSENSTSARFCSNCGSTLTHHCSACQSELPATARFCINCGQPATSHGNATDETRFSRLAATAPAPLAQKVRAAAGLSGERRMATALFMDVVGSRALAEQLGADNWATLLDEALERCSTVIYRYEGTIARLVGDELLAFFGAPVAHEDDPVRAVRAALDLLQTVRIFAAEIRQREDAEFQVRVSLSTGPVIIGPVDQDLTYDYSALGGTVNLAARIEATKQAMTVLVSEETYRLVNPFFEFRQLGQMTVAAAWPDW
jgi:class 3 adenylate cyclase